MIVQRDRGNHRYFRKIASLIICVVLSCVVVISLALFISARAIMTRAQQEEDITLIRQTASNIEALDDAAYSSLLSLYMSVDSDMIKYARDEDMFTTLLHAIRLKRMIASETIGIENVVIYNGRLDIFYSLSNRIHEYDPVLREYVNSALDAPRRKPLFRHDEKGVPVMTYSIMEGSGTDSKSATAIFMSISADAMSAFVREYDTEPNSGLRSIFLVDYMGNLIDDGQFEDTELAKWAASLVSNNKQGTGSSYLFNGDRYRVFFRPLSDSGITVVMVSSEEYINRSVNSMFFATLVTVLLAILLVMVVSMGVSRIIYKPLENLLKSIKTKVMKPAEASKSDEIAYLGYVMAQMQERLTQDGRRAAAYYELLREQQLVKLLHGVLPEEIKLTLASLSECGVKFDGAEMCVYAFCALPVELEEENITMPPSMLCFALCNVASEMLVPYCRIYPIMYMDRLELVLVMKERGNRELVTVAIQKASKFIICNFNTELVCGASYYSDRPEDLPDLSRRARNNLDYHLLYPDTAIITDETTEPNRTCKSYGIEEDKLWALAEFIASGNERDALDLMEKLLGQIQTLMLDRALLSIAKLTDTVDRVALAAENTDDKKARLMNRPKEGRMDIASVHTALSEQVKATCAGIRNNQNCDPTLALRVMAYADTHLQNPALCLDLIAEQFKLSSRYISKGFREYTGTSVKEYINQLRIEKAARLLATTEMTVGEVAAEVGIVNETYFFSMFKKRYRLTPREYSVRKKYETLQEG